MRNRSEYFDDVREWGAGFFGAHAGGGGPGRGGGRQGHGGAWFPFGRFPWGGGGGRRGPRARRGDIRAGILALLAESPRNGYQIMQELEQRSRGMWRPSPGSVYPALQQLEDEGLVKAKEVGTGRVFELTEPGQQYVAEHRKETEAPWDWATTEGEEGAHDLIGQLRKIAIPLTQNISAGEPEQLAKASKVLGEARRGLFAILAEDSDEDEE
jgi:DNA-binding PadR family transcriptional regulator